MTNRDEYGVAFGTVSHRADGSAKGDNVAWFKSHEMRRLPPEAAWERRTPLVRLNDTGEAPKVAQNPTAALRRCLRWHRVQAPGFGRVNLVLVVEIVVSRRRR